MSRGKVFVYTLQPHLVIHRITSECYKVQFCSRILRTQSAVTMTGSLFVPSDRTVGLVTTAERASI